MKLSKKIVVLSLLIGTISSVGIAHIFHPVSVAAEVQKAILSPIDLGRIVIRPNVPEQGIVGEQTTIMFEVEWVKDPDTVNVLGFKGTLTGDAVFVSMGVPADFKIHDEGKRINYINDRDGGYTSIPLVVQGDSVGEITLKGDLVYVDTTMEEELTKPVTITLNMRDSSDSLAEAKKQGKETIDQLGNLSEEEKIAFKNQVDSAVDVPTVQQNVLDAQKKNDENAAKELEKAKESAKKKIQELPNLTVTQKEDYKVQIDLSGTIPEVSDVLEKAKEDSQKPLTEKDLTDEKEAAKKEIDKMSHLSKEEKDALKKQIDAAEILEDVNQILNQAQAMSETDEKKKHTATSDMLGVSKGTFSDPKTSSGDGKTKKGGLPRTNEAHPSIFMLIGGSLFAVLGWFGVKKGRI